MIDDLYLQLDNSKIFARAADKEINKKQLARLYPYNVEPQYQGPEFLSQYRILYQQLVDLYTSSITAFNRNRTKKVALRRFPDFTSFQRKFPINNSKLQLAFSTVKLQLETIIYLLKTDINISTQKQTEALLRAHRALTENCSPGIHNRLRQIATELSSVENIENWLMRCRTEIFHTLCTMHSQKENVHWEFENSVMTKFYNFSIKQKWNLLHANQRPITTDVFATDRNTRYSNRTEAWFKSEFISRYNFAHIFSWIDLHLRSLINFILREINNEYNQDKVELIISILNPLKIGFNEIIDYTDSYTLNCEMLSLKVFQFLLTTICTKKNDIAFGDINMLIQSIATVVTGDEPRDSEADDGTFYAEATDNEEDNTIPPDDLQSPMACELRNEKSAHDQIVCCANKLLISKQKNDQAIINFILINAFSQPALEPQLIEIIKQILLTNEIDNRILDKTLFSTLANENSKAITQFKKVILKLLQETDPPLKQYALRFITQAFNLNQTKTTDLIIDLLIAYAGDPYADTNLVVRIIVRAALRSEKSLQSSQLLLRALLISNKKAVFEVGTKAMAIFAISNCTACQTIAVNEILNCFNMKSTNTTVYNHIKQLLISYIVSNNQALQQIAAEALFKFTRKEFKSYEDASVDILHNCFYKHYQQTLQVMLNHLSLHGLYIDNIRPDFDHGFNSVAITMLFVYIHSNLNQPGNWWPRYFARSKPYQLDLAISLLKIIAEARFNEIQPFLNNACINDAELQKAVTYIKDISDKYIDGISAPKIEQTSYFVG